MIEIGGGITIGSSIIIGEVEALLPYLYFITESDDRLVSEGGIDFVTEGL
jgi:hypothetical protein